jgi:hypothetical protein
MSLRSAAEAALKTDPAAFIRYELADDASMGRKCEYAAIYSGDGHELLQIDRATQDQLARDGIVRAGPFDPEQRTYCFHQTAAA